MSNSNSPFPAANSPASYPHKLPLSVRSLMMIVLMLLLMVMLLLLTLSAIMMLLFVMISSFINFDCHYHQHHLNCKWSPTISFAGVHPPFGVPGTQEDIRDVLFASRPGVKVSESITEVSRVLSVWFKITTLKSYKKYSKKVFLGHLLNCRSHSRLSIMGTCL